MQLPAALCFGNVGVAAHGEGRSSRSHRILLGKVPSLVTCESREFCESPVFGPAGPGQGSDRLVLRVPRGGGWPKPCLEAPECFLSPSLSQPALTQKGSRSAPAAALYYLFCGGPWQLPCQGWAVSLCFIIIRPGSSWREMKSRV